MEATKDFFQHQNDLPENIQQLCQNMESALNEGGDDYQVLAEHLQIFEANGWTFDYYLDAIPFDLHKIETGI